MPRQSNAATLYMIVENFRNGDPKPIYSRFQEKGRLAPEGLTYINSWIDTSLGKCFQLMEATEPGRLTEWMSNWRDIVEFEVYPVISSAEAARRVAEL